ncbi:hypothetical protein ACOAKG_21630 [Streptomyces sp. JL3001]|uniref:hypothetical protein n=1 Tax=Streptomyces sp. JL3001 TaxID=3400923 RepID=UPI003B28967A
MPRIRLKASTILSVGALAIASSLTLSTPAYAAPQCSDYQTFTFGTPGDDTKVKIRLCVRITNGKGFYRAQGSWSNGGGHFEVDKFEKFDIILRLERNQATYSSGRSSVLANDINYNETGSFDDEIGPATPDTGGSLPSGKWTTDGYVNYNINNDGDGNHTLQLTGSPSITR